MILQCYHCGFVKEGSRNRKFTCPVCKSGSYQWYITGGPHKTTPKERKRLEEKERQKYYAFKMSEVFG